MYASDTLRLHEIVKNALDSTQTFYSYKGKVIKHS